MGGELTQLINCAGSGEQTAVEALWREVYDEVRAIARQACSHETSRTQIQPTLVVNELFLKMFGNTAPVMVWENRRHFFGSVSRGMSQYLIDHARTHGRARRGGEWQRTNLEIASGELEDTTRAFSDDAAAAMNALNELETYSPVSAEVARLRFITGLSIDQTALLLDVSPRTVCKRWNFAQAWLKRALTADL